MSEIINKIFENGAKEEFPANHSISLSDPSALLFLEKGSINLFAIERKEGKAEGQRTLIVTLEAPAPLFGFSMEAQSPLEIVAITEQPSCLWRVALSRVENDIDRDPTFIFAWINALAASYKNVICKDQQIYIEPSQQIKMGKEEVLAPQRAITHREKKTILWIKLEEGEVEFLGYPSLKLTQEYFPLTYAAWIKSRTEAVITASAMIKEWKAGLFHFHRVLYAFLYAHREVEETHLKVLAEKRALKEEEAIEHSLLEMVSILSPLEPSVLLGSFSPVFKACQLVVSEFDVSLQMPQQPPESDDVAQLIKAIAEASSLRDRQVKLVGTWWKKSCGHFIAFYGSELKPVAILEKKSGGYHMVDPESGVQTPIHASVAAELNKTGFYLYLTFPDELKTGKEVLKFYLKNYGKEYRTLVLYSLLAAIIALFPPFATKVLFSQVIPDADGTLLAQISISLFLAAASTAAFFFFRSMLTARIDGQSGQLMQTAIWDRILKLPATFFRRYASGSLILHAISFDRMRSILSGSATRVLFSGMFSIFYILAMMIYAPILALLSLGILFVGFAISLGCLVLFAKMQRQFFAFEAQINAFVTQVVSSIGKLRIAGAEKNVFANWAHLYASYQRIGYRAKHIKNFVQGMNYILPFAMYLVIFIVVIKSSANYSVGSFLAFNTAFASLYMAIIDMSNTLLNMAPILPYWDRTKIIIQEPLEEIVKEQKTEKLTGEIHIDEVFFKYESADSYVLQNVSLKANPKEFIGIVGSSGCGKSTLIRLLLGFEKPTAGAIYYDNKSLDSMSIHGLRKQIGVVLQEEGIIAGSLYDNLTCGGTYSIEQIEKALASSGLAEDVAGLPMGLHTYLSIGGGTFSGGQKQRLLIARALLPNPKILFLDEATSALDNVNQQRVLSCIDQLDVTRIVVAHRLSTIKNADRIYVIDKGHVVQVGTFEELAAQPGLFAHMLKRQSL